MLNNFWQRVLQNNLGTHISFPSTPFLVMIQTLSNADLYCSHQVVICITHCHTPTHTKWCAVKLKDYLNFPMSSISIRMLQAWNDSLFHNEKKRKHSYVKNKQGIWTVLLEILYIFFKSSSVSEPWQHSCKNVWNKQNHVF